MSEPPPVLRWHTVRQVSDALGRTPNCVRRWIYEDKIPATQLGDKGEWRIPAWWLERQLGRVPTEAPSLPRRRFVTLPPVDE